MRTIVFASKNEGKIREVTSLLGDIDVRIVALSEFTNIPDIKEDGDTFFENALIKAQIISQATGEWVLSDDSGLEVDFLDGNPGVRSARYSGKEATDKSNITKLLQQLQHVPEKLRGASFRCVLVLYRPDGSFESFEGILRGQISKTPVGDNGFGYDPVFLIPGMGVTMAQLPAETKNRISHRADAMIKLKKWLQTTHDQE